MKLRNDIWTYVIVSAVSVVVWFWAAGEDRVQDTVYAEVNFEVAGAGEWRLDPLGQPVTLVITGSKRATVEAKRQMQRITLPLPAAPMRNRLVALEARLQEVAREFGVGIVSAEPTTVTVNQDLIEKHEFRIEAALPGVQTEGDIEISPQNTWIDIPGQLYAQSRERIVVQAFVDQVRLNALEPGVRHTIDAPLRTPGIDSKLITMDPATATLTFTIASSIRETTLDKVLVHLAGPHQDFLEYDIGLEPTKLSNVTIRGEGEVIRRIEADEMIVVAIVHLSNQDKERAIEAKQVGYFQAMTTDWTEGVTVEAIVDGIDGMPVIQLDIKDRSEPPPPGD
ncbi:MAG: hypothetical protein ACYTF9_00365 [Planctomycetota bacterium]|jgi:HSP20 family molecular chaperone IbpA